MEQCERASGNQAGSLSWIDFSRTLSCARVEVRITVHLRDSTGPEKDVEELEVDVLRISMSPVLECMGNNSMQWNVHEVVLVRGSAHFPQVHAMLQGFFNGSDRAVEAAGFGAAVQAAALTGEGPP